MPNSLVIAIGQNRQTFDHCRRYLYQILGKDREKLIALEEGAVNMAIPYYISYIESLDISFNDAVCYCKVAYPDKGYWDIIKIALVAVFRRIEKKGDLEFNPF